MSDLWKRAAAVVDAVDQVILGKKDQVREVMTTFLAGGHILLVDIPGVGKTTLALAFSKAMELDYRRIQFTPDVMPSDVTGFSIYRRSNETFEYQPGAVFCNLLLADEINRTSPKTQSALLEVMEEGKVTVEGVTRKVPSPFLVIATQNPSGSAGTQRLPDSQVDRFMVSMTLGYPDYESELTLARETCNKSRLTRIEPVLKKEELQDMQKECAAVYISDDIFRYIVDLVTATRTMPGIVRGASPRATVAMVRMVRSSAWLDGRDYVIPSDVAMQLPFVLRHRLETEEDGSVDQIIQGLLDKVKAPRAGAKR